MFIPVKKLLKCNAVLFSLLMIKFFNQLDNSLEFMKNR
jgi:hypothetical protein